MSKVSEANHIIQSHAIWAMGAGVIPLPVVDIVAVTAVQMDMIQQLSTLYNKTYSEISGKAFVSSISSSVLARIGASALKAIPGIGSLIGGVSMSVMSGASTYAVGQVVTRFFEEGIDIEDIDTKFAKKVFEEELEKGKSFAQNLKKEKDEHGENTFKEKPKEKEEEDPYESLVKLKDLFDKGLLTQEEFDKMRKSILDRF